MLYLFSIRGILDMKVAAKTSDMIDKKESHI